MAMPKLALATAIATGAADANPRRYANDVDLTLHPMGPPSPEIVDADLVYEWLNLVRSISWLTEADRRLCELACLYRANGWMTAQQRVPYVDEDGVIHPETMMFQIDHKATTVELRILEKLGCTPTSRPKVTVPGKNPGDRVKRAKWW